jgi:hypothetical protein
VTARGTVDQTEDDLDPGWKLTPSGVKYREGEFDMHSVTGMVASTYSMDLQHAEVTAVCRSSSGKINGAGVAYVGIGAGETAPVETDMLGTGIKKCELYPTLGLATQFERAAARTTASRTTRRFPEHRSGRRPGRRC